MQARSRTSGGPARLLPMLAVAGRPGDVRGPDWAHEMKWDGVRALVATDGQAVEVRSRRGNDVTPAYPELAPLAAALGAPALLDGEIVALDDDGAPSFTRLQRRMHLREPLRVVAAAAEVPVTLLAFDLLMVDGTWLVDRPYDQRRERLLALGLAGPSWAVPPATDDLEVALRTADAQGLEGVVSKRRGSPYRLGVRSSDWRKLRLVTEQEFVVTGFRRGSDGRPVGSLLLGIHDRGGRLVHAGSVGSGISAAEGEELARLLVEPGAVLPAGAPSDPGVRWVRPEVVVQVRFREWTPDGVLRQPTYRGRRSDVDPAGVVREPTAARPRPQVP